MTASGYRARRREQRQSHRLFWVVLALPGILWLVFLFVVPLYAMLAIAGGKLNLIFEQPVAVWAPLQWNSANLVKAWHDVAGAGAFDGPIVIRTIVYVAVASVLSLVIAYPVAYFVARFGGRRKGLLLVLLIAPFWISYMMRMLAWVDLLQINGYVNSVLSFLHLASHPVDWLSGQPVTVVLGLVYGYIPYLVLVLYAGLDRIDPALIEAGRDLGLGRVRTFVHITLPLSRQAILTGMLITVLPMLGDYFTNQLLSGTAGTTMFGNVINDQLSSSGGVLQGEGAVFSMLFLLVLIAPMIYYVVATNRSSRGAA